MKSTLLLLLGKLPPNIQGRLRVAFYNFLIMLKPNPSDAKFSIQSAGGGVWLLSRGSESLYIAIPNRVGFYKEGIGARLDALQSAFGVEKFNLSPGDFVVDIGTNIGEFSLPILCNGAEVALFEMDPNVIEALKKNVSGYDKARIYNFGLWNETKQISMFVKSGSADTSLIDNGATERHDIPCFRLDDVGALNNVSAIKLLKCDAEGAEPEVLQGAVNVLKRTQFVSIDCGPERGREGERTLDEVKELLVGAGFRILQERYGNREILIAENSRYACDNVS